ncbi:hypothetical protein ACFC1R_09625 [Kitasatospora sp. NPDC056138]|uniref:hypothetical protein n=1 Tax=Kitasatospora sp. NPDC056138 TaxID=3345724 RepID=UPI0035DAA953
MIVIHPVLESGALDDFVLWPVADQPPHRLVPLNGTLSGEQVGAAVATIAGYNDSRTDPRSTDPAATFLSPLLHEEGFLAPGGLRVRDTEAGTVLNPGCCCGLEDWRAWLEVADGGEMWLGHDPTPWAEQAGETLRLHPDGEHPGPAVELTRADLRRLLADVQRDLADFLLLVADWAGQYAPRSAEALVGAFDSSLQITAPLSRTVPWQGGGR